MAKIKIGYRIKGDSIVCAVPKRACNLVALRERAVACAAESGHTIVVASSRHGATVTFSGAAICKLVREITANSTSHLYAPVGLGTALRLSGGIECLNQLVGRMLAP